MATTALQVYGTPGRPHTFSAKAPEVIYSPDIQLTVSINRTLSLTGTINRTASLTASINRTVTEESELT